MHEASIAESLVNFLLNYERDNNFLIKAVTLEIGKFAGVNVESLSFCLNAVSNNLGRSWSFNFCEKPLLLRCNDCSFEFESEEFCTSCKKCNGFSLNIISGFEMHIIELEGDEIEGKGCSVFASGK